VLGLGNEENPRSAIAGTMTLGIFVMLIGSVTIQHTVWLVKQNNLEVVFSVIRFWIVSITNFVSILFAIKKLKVGTEVGMYYLENV
jgi:hypothetical protein